MIPIGPGVKVKCVKSFEAHKRALGPMYASLVIPQLGCVYTVTEVCGPGKYSDSDSLRLREIKNPDMWFTFVPTGEQIYGEPSWHFSHFVPVGGGDGMKILDKIAKKPNKLEPSYEEPVRKVTPKPVKERA